jgi:hypothetical protein
MDYKWLLEGVIKLQIGKKWKESACARSQTSRSWKRYSAERYQTAKFRSSLQGLLVTRFGTSMKPLRQRKNSAEKTVLAVPILSNTSFAVHPCITRIPRIGRNVSTDVKPRDLASLVCLCWQLAPANPVDPVDRRGCFSQQKCRFLCLRFQFWLTHVDQMSRSAWSTWQRC